MKYFLLLLGLAISCGLFAQTLTDGYRSTHWSVELSGGANFAVNHNPVLDRISTDGRNLLPGMRGGLAGVMSGELSKSSLMVGVDIIQDRVDLLDYREEPLDVARQFGIAVGSNGRVREGTLRVRETQLRVRVQHRVAIKKFDVEYGLLVSGRIGGDQRYDFQQTTTDWVDPITGQLLAFDEPLMSNGSYIIPEEQLNSNTYGGFLLGGGYRITPRLGVRVEWELGVNLRNGIFIENRYKQYHERLGISLSYGLFGE